MEGATIWRPLGLMVMVKGNGPRYCVVPMGVMRRPFGRVTEGANWAALAVAAVQAAASRRGQAMWENGRDFTPLIVVQGY